MIQGPYHFIPIGILSIILYLLSLLAARMQIWKIQKHRQFWNIILAIVFISTVIIGLILALKVNYKWKAPWFDSLLQWHVDIGAGMAFAGIFHLTWHLGYYLKLFKPIIPSVSDERWSYEPGFTSKEIRIFFVILGTISIIAQLVLLREFLKSLHGNELIIGLMLSVWMILTAVGAWAGSAYYAKMHRKTILALLLTFSGLPIIIYLVNILLTRFLLLPGYEPGLMESLMIILLLLLPVTLLSGFLFGNVVKTAARHNEASNFYMLDSVGSLTGGLLFGGILVFFLDNIQVLALLCLVTVCCTAILFKMPGTSVLKILMISLAGTIFMLTLIPWAKNHLEGLRYRHETVLECKDTPYGNLTYTERAGQINAYADATPYLTSNDVAQAEESVHYFALQYPNPKDFLLISGGLYGTLDEIRKYNPERIDYCEPDPMMIKMNEKFFEIKEDEALHVLTTDGRTWLLLNEKPYDIIISLTGYPYTLAMNRYYTTNFFRLVKRNLKEGGVFGLKLPPSGNYINLEGLRLNSVVYNSLMEVFSNVLVIPGASNYYVASDHKPDIDIPSLVAKHNFENIYVNADYLDKNQLQFENNLLMEELGEMPAETNQDLWPKAFYMTVSGWLSKQGGSLKVIGIFGVVGFLALLIFLRSVRSGIFIAGFTGAGIQILLIMVLQSFYGYAYIATPLMVTMFMAGIVLGVLSWKKIWKSASISRYTGLLWFLAIFSGALLILLKQADFFTNRFPGLIILFILNLVPGMIVGNIFTLAINLTEEHRGKLAGTLFGADLAGASAGTFLTALILLPTIGATYTLILFSVINIAAGFYLLSVRGKKM